MVPVALFNCPDYQMENVEAGVRHILAELGGMDKIVSPGQKVALKLNLIARKKPDEAATTHPAVVEAVVREIQRCGGKVVLCDSPGGPYSQSLLKAVYRATGMVEVAEKTGADLNYDTSWVTLAHPEGKMIHSLPLIKPLAEADVVVGLSKLKTHGMTGFTGAVKLFYGAIPGLKKAEYHFNMPDLEQFSRLLIDIVKLIKPSLSIMDGIVGMEGDGPTSGDPRHLGLLLGSVNPFALDMAACRIIGIEPEKLPLFKAAAEQGLITGDAPINLTGNGFLIIDEPFRLPSHMSIHFNLPPLMKKILGKWIQPRPWFNRELCAGCGDCLRACPAGAVKIRKKTADVDINACIRCFCCQELCPAKAVSVRRSWLGRMLIR